MKKAIAILLAMVLLASLATGVAAAQEVYEGTGNGRNGPVRVSVTMEDGKITEINILEQSETAGVADGALEQIPAEIIRTQSTAVDAVTGATLTSSAIIEAVEDCLRQAGEDVEAWHKTLAKDAVEKETMRTPGIWGATP